MNLTVLILTLNEEVNLPHALRSVAGWADQIIVVDSFSQDRTVEIARSFGAEVYQNEFVNHVRQRNWALEVPKYQHEWVLYIDADEQVTPELRREIDQILPTVSEQVAGFEMSRRYIFLGRWLKHVKYGGSCLRTLRLLRLGRSRFVTSARAGEYAVVQGKVERLKNDLLHHDQRSLAQWIKNQNHDTSCMALKLFDAGGEIKPAQLGKREVQEGHIHAYFNRLFFRMPLAVNPILRFLIAYFLRGGWLDGWQGFVFCALHPFWVNLLISVKMREYAQSPYALEEARHTSWR